MNEKVPNIIWIDEPDGVYYTEPLDGSVEYHRALSPAEVEAKAGRAARLILNAPLEDSAPDDCDCSDHQRMREVAAIITAAFGGEK